MSNLNTFLEKIRDLKSDKLEGIAISKSEVINLEPLNLKQQKNIISSSFGGVKNNILFLKAINEILIESSGDNSLLICDRAPLLVALRINSIGDKYNNLDLNQIIDNYKNYKINYKLEDKITYKSMSAELNIPSLNQENAFINRMESLLKEGDNSSFNLGIMYSHELAKFIAKVSIDDIKLDLSQLSIPDRVSVVEKLPLSLTKLVLKFIEAYKIEENKLLRVGERGLSINVDFFDIE